MRAILPVVLLLFSGCTYLLGDSGSECQNSLECPLNEICTEGMCIYQAPSIDWAVDSFLPDVGTPDQALVPLFPDGLCFAQENGSLRGTTAMNSVPRGYCSKWGILWTEVDSGRQNLIIRTSDEESAESRITQVSGPVEISGRELFVARYNDVEQSINIWRHDLGTGEGEYLKPSSRDQAHPSRGGDFTAFTELDRAGREIVYVHFDDGTVQSCAMEGRYQRGVIAGNDWLAWIEHRVGSRNGRIIIAPSMACAAPTLRRERLLTGEVPNDGGLRRANEELFWLIRPTSGANQLRRWKHKLIREEPETYPLSSERGNPVELAARGRWVSMVHYRDISPRFVLEVIDLSQDRTVPVPTTGNVHQPTLNDNYVIWAQGSGTTGWEVRYEVLD